MDKIRIEQIKVFAHHGVLDEEKKNGQDFFITIEMELNLKYAGVSDRLEKTVNYADVTLLAKETFTETIYNTIEAAAEAVVEAILSNYDIVRTVTVKVSKPHAPIDAEFSDVNVTITRSKHIVYLGIGSNLGDKRGYLNMAVEELGKDESISSLKVSEYIETEPYGPVEQPDFLNGVVEIETTLEPMELLTIIHDIEQEAGRERIIHWGPRTLDIDILLYDDRIINTSDLTIPHPEMHKRDFVLKPLVEIALYVYHPILMKTAVQMYTGCIPHISKHCFLLSGTPARQVSASR